MTILPYERYVVSRRIGLCGTPPFSGVVRIYWTHPMKLPAMSEGQHTLPVGIWTTNRGANYKGLHEGDISVNKQTNAMRVLFNNRPDLTEAEVPSNGQFGPQ